MRTRSRPLSRTHGSEVAAIICEPILCNSGCIEPHPGYLERLRELADAYGCLLVLDEVITGFRLGLGGAQERFGVQADLVVFGKAVAGGLPLAGVAGTEAVLGLVADGTVPHMGTLNGNTVATAAARATLDVLARDDGSAYGADGGPDGDPRRRHRARRLGLGDSARRQQRRPGVPHRLHRARPGRRVPGVHPAGRRADERVCRADARRGRVRSTEWALVRLYRPLGRGRRHHDRRRYDGDGEAWLMVAFAEYIIPPDTAFLATLRQVGVDDVITELDRTPEGNHDNTGEQPWDYAPLARMKERYEAAGMRVAGVEDWPPMDLTRLGRPGRDEEIDLFCRLVENLGKLGIPMLCYNWMPVINWLRTRTAVPARGGALVTGFDLDDLADYPPTWAGDVGHDELWAALTYFLERVVPVAEKAGVRLALHPDDPPLPSVRGVGRIMTSVEAFERALKIVPSHANAICLCQGNFTLMTDELPEVIRHFGSEGAIAFGHFRDVRGTPERYFETFHDDGPTDMLACMDAWHDFEFDGVLRPDHVPTLDGEDERPSGLRVPGSAARARLHDRSSRGKPDAQPVPPDSKRSVAQ